MKRQDLDAEYIEYQASKMGRGEAVSTLIVIALLAMFGMALARERHRTDANMEKIENTDTVHPTDAMIRNLGQRPR